MNQIIVSGFYQFIELPYYQDIKQPLLEFCLRLELKGTILLAQEGINASVSGHRNSINELYQYLNNTLSINVYDAHLKENIAEVHPFLRMKIKLKPEIVRMGIDNLAIEKNGDYIDPKDWDQFIAREDVLTIDTRNNYEVALGSFVNSINPGTRSFTEFPAWVEKNLPKHKKQKIAMFCTGGIRCEKSTAYLKQLGFEEVYHLKGGILQYLQDTHNANQKWQGDCFVFDDRVAVNTVLQPIEDRLCKSCQEVLRTDDFKRVDPLLERCAKCVGVDTFSS